MVSRKAAGKLFTSWHNDNINNNVYMFLVKEKWGSSRSKKRKNEEDHDTKWLALTAHIEEPKKSLSSDNRNLDNSNNDSHSSPKRDSWWYKNVGNLTKQKRPNGQFYYWCSTYCHPRMQWYIKKDYMDRACFKNKMTDQYAESGGETKTYTEYFKVGLAAIPSKEYYVYF